MGAPVLLSSQIDAVAVYRRGALVTRVATIPPSLPSHVRIGPLPLGVDDGSVRVAVRGDGVLATDVSVTLEVPEPDPALAPARPEDLEAAEQRVAKIEDQLAQIDHEAARVESIGVVERPAGRPGREPPPSPEEARRALLELREARLAELDDRRERVARELRDARLRLADLREREARASSARRAEPDELKKAVVVALRGDAGGDGPARVLAITYRIDAARWAPSYVLQLDDTMQKATLEVRAAVAQASGEDWDGVTMTLSTATLAGWAELPELPALRIGRATPRTARRGWRPPPVGTDALFADFDRARPKLPPPAPPAPPMSMPVPVGAPMPSAPTPASTAVTMTGARTAAAPPRGGAPVDEGIARAELELEESPEPARSYAAPAPQAMPMMAKRSGAPLLGAIADAVGGLVGSGGSADAPALATLDLGDAGADGEILADDALLRYGALRMPGPTSTRRGHLVVESSRERYRALVEEHHVDVDLDATWRTIAERAAALDGAALPPGCRPPAPSGFDYVYRADGRLRAPSDGAWHQLALSRRDGAPKARFVIVPRESRDAFRFVEMDNPLDAPLLDGPIDVHVGDDYLMTSAVREVPPSGVLRLGLGVEQRIKVARNTRFKEKSGGLMGGRLDLEHTIAIDVENHLPREADLEVRERLPVTREGDDDVEVRDVRAEPAWEAWEPDDDPSLRGGHRWQLRLPAGQKRELEASYVIRIASKNELVGGNRRER